jgi:glycosyltransferase involved in cell wall biosynthesis
MRRARIVVVAPWWPTVDNPAAGRFIVDQAATLSRHHDVAVVALRQRIPRRVRKLAALAPDVLPAEVPVVDCVVRPWLPRRFAVPVRPYATAIGRALDMLALTWGIPEILHAHLVEPPGVAALVVGHHRSMQVVVTQHSRLAGHLRTPSARRVVRDTLRRADAVIAVSPSLAVEIRTVAPGADVRVVGNVVDVAAFAAVGPPPPGPRPVHLLAVSLLVRDKGVDVLLRAAGALRERGIEFELAIVGDGPERSGLERLALSLGLHDAVRFVGMSDRAGIVDRLAWSDVLVHPSFHETFGVAVAEAMAAGRPVITTRSGGPEWFATPVAGQLVEPGDITGLADAIERLARGDVRTDPAAERDEIRRRFGAEEIAEQLTAIYEGMVS